MLSCLEQELGMEQEHWEHAPYTPAHTDTGVT